MGKIELGCGDIFDFELDLLQHIYCKDHTLYRVVSISDRASYLSKPDSRLVPIRCKLGLGVRVPLCRAVNVLEPDERASLASASDFIHGQKPESRRYYCIRRGHLNLDMFLTTNAIGKRRVGEQTQRGKPPVSLQNDQGAIVRVCHDQWFNVKVAIGGNGLEKLVQLSGTIQPGYDGFFGVFFSLP